MLLPAISITTWLRAGAAAAVLLVAWWALHTYGAGREADGRAAVHAEWDAQRASQERAAAAARAANRALETELAAQQQKAQHDRETERAAARRAAADLRADRDRLRDAIDAYAAGGGLAAQDTGPACRERAAQLGRALDEALHAHGECTAQAVDLATDVRSLLAAWPVMEQTHDDQ